MKAPQESNRSRPGIVLASLWIVVAVLSIYGAHVIQDEVDQEETLSEQGGLDSLLNGVTALGDTMVVDGLRSALGRIRTHINEPHTVWVEQDLPEETEGTAETPSTLSPDKPVLVSRPKPRRILIIGASSIQFAVGVELERTLNLYANVKVKRFGQLATGLSRPDFMDWPTKFEELATSFSPDLVIINFGGNDAQPIPLGKNGKYDFWTDEWDRTYAERIEEIILIAKRHKAETVWLGMPIMRSAAFSKKMVRLNRVMKHAVESHDQLFISTYPMASTPSGAYRKTVRFEDERGLMRTSDGVHYTRLGARYLVEQVLRRIERRYLLTSTDETLAVAEPYTLKSNILERSVSLVAYTPRTARAGQPAPVVVLFPEHGAPWTRWPDHPHRNLQRLAQQYGMVLAVPDVGADGWYLDGAEKSEHFLSHLERELLPALLALPSVDSTLGLAGVASGGHGALLVASRGKVDVRVVSLVDAPLAAATLGKSATVLQLLGDNAVQKLTRASPLTLLQGARIPAFSVRVLDTTSNRYQEDLASLKAIFASRGDLRTRSVPSTRLKDALEELVKSQAERLTGRDGATSGEPPEPTENGESAKNGHP